jgi:hypothetical protein
MHVSIADYGALSDGVTNSAKSIQAAINEVAANGGGRVLIPAGGSYLSGSFELLPKVELHLESGALLIASGDYADYTPEYFIDNLTDGEVNEVVLPKRAFIVGFRAHGCSITGLGTISGNADAFISTRGEYIHQMRGPIGGRDQYLERPFTIFLIESYGVNMTGITITDPAFWAVRFTGCNNLDINGIRILSDLMIPNGDGIDIDRCQDVRITNSHFETADDCISLKSCAATSQYGLVDNVIISNCFFKSTSGAITLGTESVGDITNVIISNCIVRDSHRGFAIRSREGGTISKVLITDCIVQTRAFSEMWWGHGEALHVTAFSWDDPVKGTDGNIERTYEGKVRDISFRNIRVTTEASTLVWAAHPELIKDVTFENIEQEMLNQSKWPHRIDLRPNGIIDVVRRKHNAFDVMNSTNVTIRNSRVTWAESTREMYGDLIASENSPGLVVESLIER